MENHNLIVAHYRSLTPDPALLSTSRESRYYALKMYKRTVLATEYLPDSVYFEYEPDTMYLGASIMDRFTRSSEFMWDPHPAIFQGGERYITVDEVREHMERHVQFVNSYSYDGADHLREHIGACGRNYSEIPDGAILWLDGKEKHCPDVRILYQLGGSKEYGDGSLEREWEKLLSSPAPPCELEACWRVLSLN
jgi:hypothetical protein